jgi:sialidase-1
MTIDRRGLLLAALAMPAVQGARREFFETHVYHAGDSGYHTYRIPALLATESGALLAFAEARKDNAGDHGNIDLVVKRSEDGGNTWSQQAIIYDDGGAANVTIGNPCPVLEATTGKILLPFTRNNDDVLITESTDDGRTWSKPAAITRSVKRPEWTWYATGPGVGIQIRRGRYKGRLIVPCDHREPANGRPVKISHVFLSDDGGKKWQLGGSAQRYTDECQVVELSDGSLLLNMRNYWGIDGGEHEKDRKRAISHSTDGGATWSALTFDAALVEPVCQAALISSEPRKRGAARALLFSNPASRDARVRMTVKASFDDGKTWPAGRTIYAGPSAYSSLASLHDGQIGLLYERGDKNPYEKITYARFTLDWLRDQKGRRVE